MPKEEWGVKRLCPHCASRFYDLNKNPMTCPVCSNSFTLESITEGRSRVLIAEKSTPKNQVDMDDLDDTDLDDDAGDVDLDDDLLEDDDDDNVSLDEIADVSSNDDDS
ncbi:FYDLN acid domain-containing protein [Pseudothioclava arenosa]|uniref:TIGR02300 family protein n=1 Tax=Pseudothioclava arenosa TaxID=1795308 RepID=A0A2A4CUB8_9RHOB|nr:FYDLN acid domain-containing protein [Pseudothioclava arenosa]PCD77940.1 TIGR02300 family protein [Pseudothioclava arenosa]